MRVGLSWKLDPDLDTTAAWSAMLAEIEAADQLGFDSVWINEDRGTDACCPSPTLLLTHAARRTRSIQLRSAARRVTHANPVRLAEEVAVLDLFSRGRAGIAFAAATAQGIDPAHVHETIEFIRSAWAMDELRYRGKHVRFPTHTPDDAPLGATEPAWSGAYVPQWEWGPAMPDFLAITPKPYVPQPPVYVAIDDDTTLDWAASTGVAPVVGADTPANAAIARLARYREAADAAGRPGWAVEAVLERRISIDGSGDALTLGGSAHDIVCAIRELMSSMSIRHIVWQRCGGDQEELTRFASEIQPMLQA